MMMLMLVSAKAQNMDSLQTDTDSVQGGILWEISKAGVEKKSYLLGTLHGENADISYEILEAQPKFREILASVDAVGTECDIDSAGLVNWVKTITEHVKGNYPAYALLPDSIERFSSLFRDSTEFQFVTKYIRDFKTESYIPPFSHYKLKPQFIVMLLQELDEFRTLAKASKGETGQSESRMDFELQGKAKELGKRLVYMESMQYQLDCTHTLDSLSTTMPDFSYQAHILYDYCKFKSCEESEMGRYVESLMTSYAKDDLKGIYLAQKATGTDSLSARYPEYKKAMDEILPVRNHNWIPGMKAYMQEGSCLFAVGTLHLPGKDGLIRLLRNEGYTVTPIPLDSKKFLSAVRDGNEKPKLPSKRAIPFVFDRHLYVKATLKDSIHANLIYDSGADYLYLDEDFLRLSNQQDALGKRVKASMGGAGNGAPTQVDVISKKVGMQLGNKTYTSSITPIIRLRDILGRHTDGMIGNKILMSTSDPLLVSFSGGYLLPLYCIQEHMLEGFTKLNANYKNNRIDVEATLTIDDKNVVSGLFRMDLGSGSGITLTSETYSKLNVSDKPKAFHHTQAGGIGGASSNFLIRANRFIIADTLSNLVVECSENTEGALSTRDYAGLIGTQILSLYDIIFDPQHQAVYLKRISKDDSYTKSSTIQMNYYDRTDICDGWVVNGLYKGGIAERAGIEIGDIILSINGRSVKDLPWEEQRKLRLKGKTSFSVKKKDGSTKDYVLNINKQIL